jgi:hypothetical protein
MNMLKAVLDFFTLSVGCYTFLRGTWNIVWEFWSWAVLGTAGERALLLGTDPRIKGFTFNLIMQAGGLALVLYVLSIRGE